MDRNFGVNAINICLCKRFLMIFFIFLFELGLDRVQWRRLAFLHRSLGPARFSHFDSAVNRVWIASRHARRAAPCKTMMDIIFFAKHFQRKKNKTKQQNEPFERCVGAAVAPERLGGPAGFSGPASPCAAGSPDIWPGATVSISSTCSPFQTFSRKGFTGFYWVSLRFLGAFLGFTRFYWVLLGFTGFYRVLPGFTGFYWVLLGFTEIPWAFLGFTRFYWVLMGFTGFYWVLLGFTEFYWVLLGFTGFHWALLGFFGFYWVLQGFTGFYRVLMGFTGFF